MTSPRLFALVLAALCASSGPALAQGYAAAVQPQGDADRLAAAMRTLGSNPQNVEALVTAAELSLRLNDASGAASLFARADKVDPRNARVKAGMAALLVHEERPGEALRYFNMAEGYGLPVARFAAERGLAFDLIGEQERAQRDYRVALASGANDEVLRRYALSLGIAGKQQEALAQIDPLVRRNDRGAWRARAFILAMTGDVAGANKITTTMLPTLASGLAPFLERLPRLAAVDRAFAVHFGEVRPTPQRLADARLTPPLPALAPEPGRATMLASLQSVKVAPLSAREQRQQEREARQQERAARRRQRSAATQVAAAAVSTQVTPAPSRTTSSRTQPATTRPPVSLAAATPARPPVPLASPVAAPATVTAPSQVATTPRSYTRRFDAFGPDRGEIASARRPASAPEPARATAATPVPLGTVPQPAASPEVAATASSMLPRASAATPPPGTGAAGLLAVVTPRAVAPAVPSTPAGTTVSTSATGAISPTSTSSALALATSRPIATASPGGVPPATAIAPAAVAPTAARAPTPTFGAASPIGAPTPARAAPAVVAARPVATAPNVPTTPRNSESSLLERIVAGITVPASELGVAPPVPTAVAPAATPAATPTVAVQPAASTPSVVTVRAEAEARRPAPSRSREADAPVAKPERTARADTKPRIEAAAPKSARTDSARRSADNEQVAAARKGERGGKTEDIAAATRKGDRTATKDKASAPKDKGTPKEAPTKSEPARIWVQVAGGANEDDLAKAWKTQQGKAAALKGKSAYSTPLRATNRVVTGPFKTDAEARAFVNTLAKQGVSAFPFTSDKGQKMTKLGTTTK